MTETKHILVVEDEQATRAALEDYLSREGFRVTLARNGNEGLQIIANDMPDLIISDVMMPVLDGRNMLKQMRRMKKAAHIPVIILTQEDDMSVVADMVNCGGYEYLLTSDTSLEDIVDRVKAHFDTP